MNQKFDLKSKKQLMTSSSSKSITNDIFLLSEPDVSSRYEVNDIDMESSIECYGEKPYQAQLGKQWNVHQAKELCWIKQLHFRNGEFVIKQSSLQYQMHYNKSTDYQILDLKILPHHMGNFKPINFFVTSKLSPSSSRIIVKEKVYFYGIWHIFNFGHWIHDNMLALYATMMQHGGVDRNNRIVAVEAHEYDKPVVGPIYEANKLFMDSLTIFSKHKIVLLSEYESEKVVTFENAIVGISDDYVMYNRVTPLKASIVQGFVKEVLKFYQISNTKKKLRPLVGVISRVSDLRHITNIDLLIEKLSFNGQVDVIKLQFSGLSISEQVKLVRGLNLMMGVVGSDCNNGMFLEKEATFLQITPYKCEINERKSCPGRKVKNQIIAAGIHYKDWINNYKENAEIPWQLWPTLQERCPEWRNITLTEDVKEEIYNSNPDGCLMWDLWQHQNTIVKIDEILPIVHEEISSKGFEIIFNHPFLTKWSLEENNFSPILLVKTMSCLGYQVLNNYKVKLGHYNCDELPNEIDLVMMEDKLFKLPIEIRSGVTIPRKENCLVFVLKNDKPSLVSKPCHRVPNFTWDFNKYDKSICHFVNITDKYCLKSVSDQYGSEINLEKH